MYSEYSSFEELKQCVAADKEQSGVDAYTRNRYPIRFVLFDNFGDSSRFVEFLLEERGATLESVDKWLDADYPDIMITHTQLADRFRQYIRALKGSDSVIAPFSELARFYDNGEKKTFDALLKTVKAIEASAGGVERRQRVYVPIVGLEGKMEAFCHDSQSTVWRLKAEQNAVTYRLVLTNGTTYGVKGLDARHTVVRTMQEWLNVWKDPKRQTTACIVSTSPSIYANAVYAQPDNAFSYVSCRGAREFLTAGLQLQFGNVPSRPGNDACWRRLAEDVDVSGDFSFRKYVESYFSVSAITTYHQFVRLWLERLDCYERWLLTSYYKGEEHVNAYVCRLLDELDTFAGNALVEKMACELTTVDSEIEVRRYCLTEARRRNVVLSENIALLLQKRLEAIAKQHGVTAALKYFTGISPKEKELALVWLSKGDISASQLKPFFPDLYCYLSEPLGFAADVEPWIARYFGEYKAAKVANRYSDGVSALIKEHNADEVAFDTWYQHFSTVRTLLAKRGDIEVFYWVDGLGLDWVPLVKEILREKKDQNMFLNEVMVARALLPSTTSANKPDLQKLLPEGAQLLKAGDLDSFAHQPTNTWPSYIIRELQLVRDIVSEITEKYNGKKIAIISDHGLSYMPQLCSGLGLAGVDSDHHGRVAVKTGGGTLCRDSNYMRLDGGTVACALNHNSLCGKVPAGQGIHGGCAPEEVLVPVFIISGYVGAAEWSAHLLTPELSGADPVLRFRINNLPTTDVPWVEYDGQRYGLHKTGEKDVYQTDAIRANAACQSVSLVVGDVLRVFAVNVSVGAAEDDLFGGF